MSNPNPLGSIFGAPFAEFATTVLPLYHGPQVSVFIGSTNSIEYKLSKGLLCRQSPYFAATFEGNFKECENQSTTLEEVDGVVTARSFQMLVQWLYHHKVVFSESSPEDAITMILEFVRLADMCEVTGMESLMAGQMKKLIIAENARLEMSASTSTSACCFTIQHIASAAHLPNDHPVRDVLASAAVKEYFHHDDDKFIDMAKEYSDFAVDILGVMKATFKSLASNKRNITINDPLNGQRMEIKLKRAFNLDLEHWE